jgi:hypothetical protein
VYVCRIVLKHIRRALGELEAKPTGVDADEEASVLEMLLSRDKLSQDDVLLLILDLLMAGIDTVSVYIIIKASRCPAKVLETAPLWTPN